MKVAETQANNKAHESKYKGKSLLHFIYPRDVQDVDFLDDLHWIRAMFEQETKRRETELVNAYDSGKLTVSEGTFNETKPLRTFLGWLLLELGVPTGHLREHQIIGYVEELHREMTWRLANVIHKLESDPSIEYKVAA